MIGDPTKPLYVTLYGPGMARPVTLRLTPGEAGETGYSVTEAEAAHGPAYPGLCTQGETVGECVDMAIDAARELAAAEKGGAA